MEYMLISLVLLFLPGAMIVYLLRLDQYRYLLSFSLSYALFVLSLKLVSMFGYGMNIFYAVYFLIIILLIAAAAYNLYRQNNSDNVNEKVRNIKCCGCSLSSRFAPALIVIFLAVYFSITGAYLDLPSDVFQHLEFMQESIRKLEISYEGGYALKGSTLALNGKYWHYLYSSITLWSGGAIQDFILPASFINVTIFLLGVYYFSLIVFKDMVESARTLVFISVAAVFFTFFHFGANIFSFIRYYALAPSILNFVLYFAIMAIIIDFFREKVWSIRYILVACILFVASLYIHRQEGLFAFLMICIMSFYLFMQKHANSLKLLWQGERLQFSAFKFFTDKINILFIATQTLMLSLFVYSFLSIKRHPVEEPKIIPLDTILPFFKNLYILNPTYQFYYVISLWGGAVFLLFILAIRKFRNNAFLMAGMLSPFFTIFNPFFTDLFLRHSWTVTLWRLSYLVPIHFVAAYLVILSLQFIKQASLLKKLYGTASIILLTVLLFPFHTTYLDNTYSRIMTLKAVPVEQSPEHWSDLIEYLTSLDERKRIITDPVTGYMITALTSHLSSRAKFHRRWGGYIKYNYEDYSKHPFDPYSGFLFIINKRNGSMSKTGRVARHWPEEILQLENYYNSENMEDYISSNPERFHLLWQKDRIRVYSLGLPGKKVRAR